MPCFDARDDDYYRSRVDHLAAMLCGLCNRISAAERSDLIVADAELARWWADHIAADKQRELAERSAAATAKLREVALSKLSSDERKALGV